MLVIPQTNNVSCIASHALPIDTKTVLSIGAMTIQESIAFHVDILCFLPWFLELGSEFQLFEFTFLTTLNWHLTHI
jgi:hypothetical protein